MSVRGPTEAAVCGVPVGPRLAGALPCCDPLSARGFAPWRCAVACLVLQVSLLLDEVDRLRSFASLYATGLDALQHVACRAGLRRHMSSYISVRRDVAFSTPLPPLLSLSSPSLLSFPTTQLRPCSQLEDLRKYSGSVGQYHGDTLKDGTVVAVFRLKRKQFPHEVIVQPDGNYVFFYVYPGAGKTSLAKRVNNAADSARKQYKVWTSLDKFGRRARTAVSSDSSLSRLSSSVRSFPAQGLYEQTDPVVGSSTAAAASQARTPVRAVPVLPGAQVIFSLFLCVL